MTSDMLLHPSQVTGRFAIRRFISIGLNKAVQVLCRWAAEYLRRLRKIPAVQFSTSFVCESPDNGASRGPRQSEQQQGH
jgi:hypothetical protein